MRKKPEYPENFTTAVEASEKQERIDLTAALVVAKMADYVSYSVPVGPPLGRVASIAGNVVTLHDASVSGFLVGTIVRADDDPSGNSPRPGWATVVARNDETGAVTLESTVNISGLCAKDYLFAAMTPDPARWASTAYDIAEALEAERTRRLKP